MIRLILIGAITIIIGACASSAPEKAATTPAPAATTTATSSEAAETATDEPAEQTEDGIYALEPAKAESSGESLAAASSADEIVCRRETPTGSRFTRRVCRTRAEIEARAEQDKEELQRMRSTTSGGSCALNENC